MKKENDSIHFSETPLQIYDFFGEQLNIMMYDKYDSLSSSLVRSRTYYGSHIVFLIKDQNFFHDFSKIKNTVFKNVNFGVLHVGEGGYLENVLFENCNINKIIFDIKPKNVTFKNCKIFDVINKTESDKLDIILDDTIISDENIEKHLVLEMSQQTSYPIFILNRVTRFLK